MSRTPHWTRRSLLATGLAGLVAPRLGGAALAQAGGTVEGLANLQGDDRTQKLVEGAKKEGGLTFYTSAPVDDVKVVTDAFEKKYGVKVRVWRGSSENILQRTVVESRAKRYEADVIDTNGPEMEALYREKLLEPIKSPLLSELLPQAIPPHGAWVGTRLNIFIGAYNTNLVKPDQIPTSWEGFKDPKWKGKLGIEAEDTDWFGAIVTKMGEEKGLQLFRDIVAANGLSVRKGHTLLTNLVVSGEVPLAFTVYSYKAEQLGNNGAPIKTFVIAPSYARPNGSGVPKNAPHPHAALLFFDFMLRDAQELLAARDFTPTNQKVKALPKELQIEFIDPKVVLDENEKWTKLWNEIVVKQGRG
jgi:iron(III) transport system substrate-binding protein